MSQSRLDRFLKLVALHHQLGDELTKLKDDWMADTSAQESQTSRASIKADHQSERVESASKERVTHDREGLHPVIIGAPSGTGKTWYITHYTGKIPVLDGDDVIGAAGLWPPKLRDGREWWNDKDINESASEVHIAFLRNLPFQGVIFFNTADLSRLDGVVIPQEELLNSNKRARSKNPKNARSFDAEPEQSTKEELTRYVNATKSGIPAFKTFSSAVQRNSSQFKSSTNSAQKLIEQVGALREGDHRSTWIRMFGEHSERFDDYTPSVIDKMVKDFLQTPNPNIRVGAIPAGVIRGIPSGEKTTSILDTSLHQSIRKTKDKNLSEGLQFLQRAASSTTPPTETKVIPKPGELNYYNPRRPDNAKFINEHMSETFDGLALHHPGGLAPDIAAEYEKQPDGTFKKRQTEKVDRKDTSNHYNIRSPSSERSIDEHAPRDLEEKTKVNDSATSRVRHVIPTSGGSSISVVQSGRSQSPSTKSDSSSSSSTSSGVNAGKITWSKTGFEEIRGREGMKLVRKREKIGNKFIYVARFPDLAYTFNPDRAFDFEPGSAELAAVRVTLSKLPLSADLSAYKMI